MKKTLIYNFLLTLALYAVYYMAQSFVLWEFTNPFQWIINIPTYSKTDRFWILFTYCMYQVLQITAIYNILNESQDELEIPPYIPRANDYYGNNKA